MATRTKTQILNNAISAIYLSHVLTYFLCIFKHLQWILFVVGIKVHTLAFKVKNPFFFSYGILKCFKVTEAGLLDF